MVQNLHNITSYIIPISSSIKKHLFARWQHLWHNSTLNFLRHDIAATCVLKMPLNPNHPSIHCLTRSYPDILTQCEGMLLPGHDGLGLLSHAVFSRMSVRIERHQRVPPLPLNGVITKICRLAVYCGAGWFDPMTP